MDVRKGGTVSTLFKQKDAWHIRFYFRGKPFTKSLGHVSEHKASRAKQKLEARLDDLKGGFIRVPEHADLAEFLVRGEVVSPPAGEAPAEPFVAVKELYLEYAAPRRAATSLSTERIHLNHFERFLDRRAELPITDITTADIERFMSQRRRHVTGTTVNKELQTLRQLFDYAIKLGYASENPTYNATRFKGTGKPHRFVTKEEIDEQIQRSGLSDDELKALHRFRYLSHEEIADLLDLAAKSDPMLHPILVALTFTGMRRGEVAALEWSDVDFKVGKLWVRSRKQSRTQEFSGRDIDMHEKLAKVLRRQKRRNPKGRYVFPGDDGKALSPAALHRAFKALIKGTDFDGIGLHCLRHSFASNLAAQGIDDRLIDHYMGHQTEEMRRRYQHLFPEKKSEGIHRLPY